MAHTGRASLREPAGEAIAGSGGNLRVLRRGRNQQQMDAWSFRPLCNRRPDKRVGALDRADRRKKRQGEAG